MMLPKEVEQMLIEALAESPEVKAMTDRGIEIGRHAAQEAALTIYRVCDALPTSAEKLVAIGVACAGMIWKIDNLKKDDPNWGSFVDEAVQRFHASAEKEQRK